MTSEQNQSPALGQAWWVRFAPRLRDLKKESYVTHCNRMREKKMFWNIAAQVMVRNCPLQAWWVRIRWQLSSLCTLSSWLLLWEQQWLSYNSEFLGKGNYFHSVLCEFSKLPFDIPKKDTSYKHFFRKLFLKSVVEGCKNMTRSLPT